MVYSPPLEGRTCWDGASRSGAGAMVWPGPHGQAQDVWWGAAEEMRRQRRGGGLVGECSAESPHVRVLLPGVRAGGHTFLSALLSGAGAVGAGTGRRPQSVFLPHTLAQDGRLRWGPGSMESNTSRPPQRSRGEPSPVSQEAVPPFLAQEGACKL